MSQAYNLGMTICSTSFLVGGNWGFLNDSNPNFEEIEEQLLSEQRIEKKKLANGYLLLVNKLDLLNLIKNSAPEYIAIKEKKDINTIQKENLKSLYLEVNSSKTKKEYNVLLYGINRNKKSRQNGIEYKSFNLTVEQFFKVFFKKIIKSKPIEILISNGTDFFYKEITSEKELERIDFSQIYKALEIATTNQGAFLTFKV